VGSSEEVPAEASGTGASSSKIVIVLGSILNIKNSIYLQSYVIFKVPAEKTFKLRGQFTIHIYVQYIDPCFFKLVLVVNSSCRNYHLPEARYVKNYRLRQSSQ